MPDERYQCTRCDRWLPVREFQLRTFRKQLKSGQTVYREWRNHTCKACMREMDRFRKHDDAPIIERPDVRVPVVERLEPLTVGFRAYDRYGNVLGEGPGALEIIASLYEEARRKMAEG